MFAFDKNCIFLLQVNRPLAMKKDGIQTRKRKPKNLKSAGSGNNTDSANNVKSEPSGKAVLKQLFQLTSFLLHLWLSPFAYIFMYHIMIYITWNICINVGNKICLTIFCTAGVDVFRCC